MSTDELIVQSIYPTEDEYIEAQRRKSLTVLEIVELNTSKKGYPPIIDKMEARELLRWIGVPIGDWEAEHVE